MNIWQAIVLSIIEGVSEFLPISSTGHLILASHLLGLPVTEFQKSFEIIIQMGAILAVVVLYARRVWKNRAMWGRIIVAFIPTAVIGFLVYPFIKGYLLSSTGVVVASLALGGILMILLEKWFEYRQTSLTSATMGYRQTTAIGFYQAIAMIPGVSRSAATIYGAMAVGLSRIEAVEFSFLLAVPTMAAATGLDLLKAGMHFTHQEYLLLGIGLLGSFVVAMLAVKTFLTYVQHHSMKIFGWYRLIVAVLFWLLVK